MYMKSIVGIVLYNPDIIRLKENVAAISSQVDEVLFVDNHSDNINLVKKEIKGSHFSYIENEANYGIAKALNQICDYACCQGYTWVLTLDQDSVACGNIINSYNHFVEDDRIGLMTCRIIDRNFVNVEDASCETELVKTAITSGSYVRIDAWKKIGGFDERMFIDFVDHDFCTALIENHFKILKIYAVSILHELGMSKKIKFLKNQVVFNHSAFRDYYLIRNRIYYARKHKKAVSLFHNVLATLWRAALILTFESDRPQKFKAILKGIKDGYSMNVYE